MTTAPATDTPDIAVAVNDMLQAFDSMNEIFVGESEALERFDANAFFALQDTKMQNARRYQQTTEALLKRRAELKNLRDDLRTKLEEKQIEFSALSRRNLEAIERMKKATDRFGDTLRGAARDAARKLQTFSYGQSGSMNETRGKAISLGLSETA